MPQALCSTIREQQMNSHSEGGRTGVSVRLRVQLRVGPRVEMGRDRERAQGGWQGSEGRLTHGMR